MYTTPLFFNYYHAVTLYVYIQVFNKLIRRYKYLEKAFEEEIKKVTKLHIMFLLLSIYNGNDDVVI